MEATPQQHSDFYRSSRSHLSQEDSALLDWSAIFERVQKLSITVGSANERRLSPHAFPSVADGSNIPSLLWLLGARNAA
jgi:hypothetical protein